MVHMSLWLVFAITTFAVQAKTCFLNGKPCKAHGDCCRAYCKSGICGVCNWYGKCEIADDCCSHNCVRGRCSVFPPATTTTPKPCAPNGEHCRFNKDCCEKLCSFRRCIPRTFCFEDDSICFDDSICCSGHCDEFFCTPACKGLNLPCEKNSECCSNLCLPLKRRTSVSYVCSAKCLQLKNYCDEDTQCCANLKCLHNQCVPKGCKDEEETCTADIECCSGTCQGGLCVACTVSNQFCRKTSECCTGMTCSMQRCTKPYSGEIAVADEAD